MPIHLMHLSKNTKWPRLGVNPAQQMPISCSSLLLCLLSCNSRDQRWDKRMQHLSQHLFHQQWYKNIRGCRKNKRPVIQGNLNEMRASGGSFIRLLCFCSSLSVLLIKDNMACWHTVPDYPLSQFTHDLGCPQSTEAPWLLMTMPYVDSTAPLHWK